MRPPCRKNDGKGPGPSALKPTDTAGRPPVIIYAHPPRVYHTQPSEFKALVHKLTGFTTAPTGDDANKNDRHPALPGPAPEANESVTPAPKKTNKTTPAPGVNNNKELVVESPESTSQSHSWPSFMPAATDSEFDSDFDLETSDFLMPGLMTVPPELIFDPPNWINMVYGDVEAEGCSSSNPNRNSPAPSFYDP